MRAQNLSCPLSDTQGATSSRTRCVHPALHFESGFACLGVVDDRRAFAQVTSDRQYLTGTRLESAHDVCPKPLSYAGLAGQWDKGCLEQWLKGEAAPTLAETLSAVRAIVDSHIEFRRLEEPLLVTCWILATYFHPLFHAFPRLHAYGEKGSGKSKLLEVVSLTAFNGLLHLNPTPATLFRLIDPLRPTLCLDEVESLAATDHKDLLAIINAGYRSGARIDRVEGQDFQLRSFEVYAPMALAGISGLNPVTADRCIGLVMDRGRNPQKINRPADPKNRDFANVRDGCYRVALSRFADVQRAQDSLGLPDWLNGRHRELYLPLLVVAALAEKEGCSGVTDALLAIAAKECEDRSGPSLELEAILRILTEQLGGSDQGKIRPMQLANRMERETGVRWSAERAGQALRRLGFVRVRDRDGSAYVITRDRVTELGR